MLRTQMIVAGAMVCAGVVSGCARTDPSSSSMSLESITQPSPTRTSVTADGRVTEAEPTTHAGIDGARVTITDGPNAGRTMVADSVGRYLFAGLIPSNFTVTVTADGYVSTSRVIGAADHDVRNDIRLVPVLTIRNYTLTGEVSMADGRCSDGDSLRRCRIVMIPVHNAGPLEARLTWTPSGDGNLDLVLFRTGETAPMARSVSKDADVEELRAQLDRAATYELRIPHEVTTEGVRYTLTVSSPN